LFDLTDEFREMLLRKLVNTERGMAFTQCAGLMVADDVPKALGTVPKKLGRKNDRCWSIWVLQDKDNWNICLTDTLNTVSQFEENE